MKKQSFDSLTYSNETEKHTSAYVISALFCLPAIMFLGIGVHLASFNGDWWVLLLFVPFAVILGFFAFIFYPTEEKNIYRYALTNEGIAQEWEDVKRGDVQEHLIPFSEVDEIIISMYADRIPIPKRRSFYRYNALLTIIYQEEYFFKRFIDPNELHAWVTRLEENVSYIRYTDVDVSKAFHAQVYTKVDFSELSGTSEDIVSHLVGVETYQNDLHVWEPESVIEEVDQEKKTQTVPRTRKAEKRTAWVLFIYNILFLSFVLPDTPVDSENIIELTDTILIGYMIVNLLIPTFLVFWRSFTKWYLPLLYTAVTLVSNTIGAYASVCINDFSFNFVSIIMLNIFNIVVWTGSMILLKVLKALFKFIRNQDTI